MTSYVESLVDQVVSVITTEGRVFTGYLKSFDQLMNLFLKDCYEKIYSKEEGVCFLKMGLYMIRGDNVAIVSEVDELLEKQIDYSSVKADKLKEMKLHFV
jgi:U6 snRNA-associated Sm-like protein LSm8